MNKFNKIIFVKLSIIRLDFVYTKKLSLCFHRGQSKLFKVVLLYFQSHLAFKKLFNALIGKIN